MGVAILRAPNGPGPPNPTKRLAHWVHLLGELLSRNHVFEHFRGEPLPPLKELEDRNFTFLLKMIKRLS